MALAVSTLKDDGSEHLEKLHTVAHERKHGLREIHQQYSAFNLAAH